VTGLAACNMGMCRGGTSQACRARSVEGEGIDIEIGSDDGADVQLSNVEVEYPPLSERIGDD
jgi:hypothetical protein